MLREIDIQLGRILSAIDSHAVLSNRTVFLLTCDHGGIGQGHSDPVWPESFTISFFLRGPEIPRNSDLYDLFSNRFDPGTNRVDYTPAQQPIRNGDSGNLVCALLGLPPIPGSLMQPQLMPELVPLELAVAENGARLSWSALANDLVLQYTGSLNGEWETLESGVETDGSVNSYLAAMGEGAGFFRLWVRE